MDRTRFGPTPESICQIKIIQGIVDAVRRGDEIQYGDEGNRKKILKGLKNENLIPIQLGVARFTNEEIQMVRFNTGSQ